MSIYKPRFICKYCAQDIPSETDGVSVGYVGLCGCPESQAAQELEHRMLIEQRKQARGRRTR